MPGLRIYNNIYSLNAQNSLGRNTANMGSSLEKLSTGLRVNKAADDAAALMISTSLRADIASMQQAIRNTSDSMSLLNVAEGAIGTSQQMLVRMRELAIESSTATLGSTQRASINQEFTALKTEIDRISVTTEFNGQKLLDGSLGSGVTAANQLSVQVGIQNSANDRINLNTSVDLTNLDTAALGLSTTTITTASASQSALDSIDSAINTITAARGNIGAVQNRLSMTINNLESSVENTTAADSNLRDADMAKEISKFTRDQILVQASTSMLSQANLIPQSVLQLLK